MVTLALRGAKRPKLAKIIASQQSRQESHCRELHGSAGS